MTAKNQINYVEKQLFLSTNESIIIQSYEEPKDWEDLFDYEEYADLHQKLIDNNFEKPTSLQVTSINIANSKDSPSILVQAQNGTGKTLSYVINSILRVDRNVNKVQVVILVPLLELVDQIEEYFEKLVPEGITYTKIDRPNSVIDNLGSQIVIASPGLFFSLAEKFDQLKEVNVFIIDECDEIVSNEIYRPNLLRYVEQVKRAQFLLYSATITGRMNNFINVFKPSIQRMTFPQNNTIKHFYIDCRNGIDKVATVTTLFPFIANVETFIFFNTKAYIEKVQQQLDKMNIPNDWVSGERTKDERREIVKKFRNQEIKVLLATNLLARGIDIPTCKFVINFNMPTKPDENKKLIPDYVTYLHRSGRCGRFGKEGKVFNLITNDDDIYIMYNIMQAYSIQFIEISPEEIIRLIRFLF